MTLVISRLSAKSGIALTRQGALTDEPDSTEVHRPLPQRPCIGRIDGLDRIGMLARHRHNTHTADKRAEPHSSEDIPDCRTRVPTPPPIALAIDYSIGQSSSNPGHRDRQLGFASPSQTRVDS